MNREAVSHKLRRNLARSRPCFDGRLITAAFLFLHFDQKFLINIWTLFAASTHVTLSFVK